MVATPSRASRRSRLQAAKRGTIRGMRILVAFLVSGCTVGPDYHAPTPTVPQAWNGARPDAAQAEETARRLRRWWGEFNDPVLDRLVSRAVAGNYDLRIAAQHLIEARVARELASIADLPTITASALAANQRSSTTVQWPPGIGDYRTWQTGFDASWEIDIFGGNRRALEAAIADVGAADEERRSLLVSLIAELVSDYLNLRAAQLRTVIAERNIDSQQQSLQLTERAFASGLGNDLAVAQARALVEATQATLPPLQAEVVRMTDAIAVLLGQYPETLKADFTPLAQPVIPAPPTLPVSLPSEVVRNRPDIRRAERQIAGDTARVGVAVAQLFPRFQVPTDFDFTTSTFHQLLTVNSLVWTFGLSASQTAFDFGRTHLRVRAAQAIAEGDRLNYEQTVISAFRDVEDALVSYNTEIKRHERLAASANDDRIALDRARRLYAAGLTDFLHVLDSERAVFAAEEQLALSELSTAQQSVALFKALGGGWQDILPEEDPPPPPPPPKPSMMGRLTKTVGAVLHLE
ncbi:MAG TPA: efflux transporter outer membrane subunit [Acetobacteraceae bacterium]|nr:efflux transporter outer membrane subunit [Acetobacteraceae bacterium]